MQMLRTIERLSLALVIAFALTLAACATDDPNRRTKAGAGIGAIAGAVVGNQVGGRNSRIVGAAVGALAGGAVGRYQDNQQRALEAALAEERRARQVEIERLENDVLRVSLSDQATFDFDSATVKSGFKPTLDKLAGQVSEYDKTVLHVVGHTDSTGSDVYNEGLSLRRADAVAGYLQSNSVSPARLQTEGRGEAEPRVANDTEANRSRNRRVEIYVQPVVDGREEQAMQRPTATDR